MSYFLLGNLVRARKHADQVLSLYNEARHGRLVDILNQDPKTVSLAYRARATWILGYPDQAVTLSNLTEAHARQRGHPFDLGWALAVGLQVFDHVGEPDKLLKHAEEVARLGRDNSLPFLSRALAPVIAAVALVRKGDTIEGMPSLKVALAIYAADGGKALMPYLKSVLAEAMAQLGDTLGALRLIDEVIEQIQRPGWEERYCYSEILRIKGRILALQGDPTGAEHAYLAALEWARHQQAKSWELRTAMSYARLLREQARPKQAYELVAPIYAWFTEGFWTKDLKQAKALLEELAA